MIQLSCQDFGDKQSIPEFIFGNDSFFHLSVCFRDSHDGNAQLACGRR
jgi:hypothetical protein